MNTIRYLLMLIKILLINTKRFKSKCIVSIKLVVCFIVPFYRSLTKFYEKVREQMRKQ